jgi:hypothetical protein
MNSYFIKYNLIEDKIEWLKVSNYSPTHVVISFITNMEEMVELSYGNNGVYNNKLTDEAGKIHILELNDLIENMEYNYMITLGNGKSYTHLPEDENIPLTFKTVPGGQSPTAPLTLGGKVVNENGVPISGLLVYVYKDGSFPLLSLTDNSGIFYVILSNLRESTTGNSLPTYDGDKFYIDIVDSDMNSIHNEYILNGTSPYESGIFTLK